MPRRSGKQRRARTPVHRGASTAAGSVAETNTDSITRQLLQNKPGLLGFGLSLLQLLGHGSWVGLTSWLQSTGQAATLTAKSPMSWLVVGLLGASMALTLIAILVCLFIGFRKSPRTLAVIGFCISFFTGVLATTVVFMSAIRSMAGNG